MNFVVSDFAYFECKVYKKGVLDNKRNQFYFEGTKDECEEYIRTHYGVMENQDEKYNLYGRKYHKGDLLIIQNSHFTDNGHLKCVFVGIKDECEKYIKEKQS